MNLKTIIIKLFYQLKHYQTITRRVDGRKLLVKS